MKLLDRYLLTSILQGVGVVGLAVGGLILVSVLVSEASGLGTGNYGLPQLLEYVFLQLPDYLHLVFPVVALMGSLLALGALAAGGELVVMRASGASVGRLAWSVLRTGLVLAAISLLLGELLGPQGVRMGDAVREQAKHGRLPMQSVEKGLWLRDGSDYVRIEGVLAGRTMAGVSIYRLASDGSLQAVVGATRAHFADGNWWLLDVTVTHLAPSGVEIEKIGRRRWSLDIAPDVLKLSVTRPEELSSLGLLRYIDYLRSNEVAAVDYRLALWRNLVNPVTVAVLTLFALPFSFGSLRGTGAGQRLFVGGLVGLVFFMLNEIVASSGAVYGLPPWMAASLPTLLLATLTGWWLYRLR